MGINQKAAEEIEQMDTISINVPCTTIKDPIQS